MLSLDYCTSQRSAAAHRLYGRSQGNRAGARDCTGRGYGSEITGFDAVRLWYEYERGRGDALELLPRCERGDVMDLETVIELLHPKFVEDAFSAAGGAC